MILKGSTITSVKHARSFARHLFKSENRVIEVRDSPGQSQTLTELEADLVDMQLLTEMTRGKTGIFHVAIDPRESEHMDHSQWNTSIAMIEEEFGLAQQIRIEVFHEKKSRAHMHVFWSLVDQDQAKLIQLRYFKRKLQRQADLMEKRFGHARTRRTPNPRSLEISNTDRMLAARGVRIQERKRMITALWEKNGTGQEFNVRLAKRGLTLAQGERCRYVVVDQKGNVSNLVRQLPKAVRLKQVEVKMGVLYHTLPTLDIAKNHQRQSKRYRIDEQVQRIKRKKQVERVR